MKNFAQLRAESPFYPLFECGCVPIKTIIVPSRAVCEGDGTAAQEVYMVDLDKLTEQQFNAVTDLVHRQCDPSVPIEVARKEIKARGLPLRAKHVATVSSDCPFFL